MTENPEACGHISLLTPRPNEADANAQSRRLGEVPRPFFAAGFWGEHPRLGRFKVKEEDSDHVQWHLAGSETQSASLQALSSDHSYASSRLDLGWLISALHELEGVHISETIPDPKEAMKEMSKWRRKARAYYRWAIAPVEKIAASID